MRALRLSAALAAVLAGASLLGACGGSDSTETSPPAFASPTTGQGKGGEEKGKGTGASTGSSAAEADSPVQRKRQVARERAAYEKKRYGNPSKQSAPFVAAARQGQLKHLPEFGQEASSGQRDQAQATLAAYLAAVAAKEWQRACGYLLPYYVSTLEAARAGGSAGSSGDGGCEEALQALAEEAAKQPGPKFPDSANPHVSSLRIEAYSPDRAKEFGVEEAGFALLHGSDGNDYYATLTREGGRWKVTVAVPSPLG